MSTSTRTRDRAGEDVVQSLLGGEGIRFMFSSFVNNFAGFTVVAVVSWR